MKLLLTSAGLSNDSIAKAFGELVGATVVDGKIEVISEGKYLVYNQQHD